MFVACQTSTDDGKETGNGTTVGTNGTTETKEPETTLVSDDLPDELNFDGMTIRTACREDYAKYFTGEDGSDVVFQAIYDANMAVEERLGITREIGMLSTSSLTQSIVTAILSGDNVYDYVPVDQFYGPEYCTYGMYADLADAPYLDFSKPWYYTEYMESCSIGDKNTFFIAGDASSFMLPWMYCVYVNKTVYVDLFNEEFSTLYQKVEDGSWTLDEYSRMCSEAYADIDKVDGTSVDDILGQVVYLPTAAEHFTFSAGFEISEKNDQGYYDIVVEKDQNFDIVDKVSALFYSNPGTYVGDFGSNGGLGVEKFANDTALFCPTTFIMALEPEFREMKSDYCMVPLPKYDETQEDYISTIHNSAFLLAVPVNVPEEKWEAVCATIEAQGSENYRTVYPTYIETALKVKYNHDEDNAESAAKMIDIIHDNLYVDFAYVYSNCLSDVGRIAANAIETQSSLAQQYAGVRDAVDIALQSLIDTYESDENYFE